MFEKYIPLHKSQSITNTKPTKKRKSKDVDATLRCRQVDKTGGKGGLKISLKIIDKISETIKVVVSVVQL